ncbi:hypothetical protein Tco_0316113 [Tanacetum coccineum]
METNLTIVEYGHHAAALSPEPKEGGFDMSCDVWCRVFYAASLMVHSRIIHVMVETMSRLFSCAEVTIPSQRRYVHNMQKSISFPDGFPSEVNIPENQLLRCCSRPEYTTPEA